MKKLGISLLAVAMLAVMVPTQSAEAATYHYTGDRQELINYLYQLIAELQARDNSTWYYYNNRNYNNYGSHSNVGTRVISVRSGSGSSRSGDDEPEVETISARDIEDDSAELRGEVDMEDFNNGEVFFVYGEDEDDVEDVEDEDEYRDIDENGDDLQKVLVDRDLDNSADYELTVYGLDEDTRYYFQICVGYEDEDDDEVIECGGVEEFTTDDDNGSSNNDDEPEAFTDDAEEVEDDEAELHGEVDMNDFNNGEVFFVYGEDEDQVEDVEDEYDSYSDVDEDGDDLQKVLVDSDLDGFRTYWERVVGLDDNTDYYFQICVGYEDEDDDDVLECGGVEHFETD